jgi:hypothetical protein
VRNPPGNRELDLGTRTRNALLRDLRYRGERGFALITQRWAALQHVSASPSRITDITRPRPRPIRAQIHQVKLAEITSLSSGISEQSSSSSAS